MGRRRSRADWIMAGLSLLTFAVVTWVSNAEKGLAAGVTLGVFITIILTKRETHKESLRDRRFWLVIASFAVIHIVAISIIRFPQARAGMVSLPFALVDGFLMWGFINWIERHFPRPDG